MSNSELTVITSVVRNSLLLLLPARFGLFGEIVGLQQQIMQFMDANPEINEIVLDFGRTTELEQAFPSRFERVIAEVEKRSEQAKVRWQNASNSIEYVIDTINFGRGGEIDTPVTLTSELLGPDAMTSETRMEQDNVDDLLASLGL